MLLVLSSMNFGIHLWKNKRINQLEGYYNCATQELNSNKVEDAYVLEDEENDQNEIENS